MSGIGVTVSSYVQDVPPGCVPVRWSRESAGGKAPAVPATQYREE